MLLFALVMVGVLGALAAVLAGGKLHKFADVERAYEYYGQHYGEQPN